MVAQVVQRQIERLQEEYSFYTLPEGLAARMYAWYLQRVPDLAELPLAGDRSEALNFGRTVSETLYRILASMARTGAQRSGELSLHEALMNRLPVMLNLADPGENASADPPEVVEMCLELVNGFVRWLQEEKGGVCLTGWGRVKLDPNGDLFLVYTLPRYKRPARRRQQEGTLSMTASAAGD